MYDKTYYAELYKNYISYTAIKDVLADIEKIDYASNGLQGATSGIKKQVI